MPHDHAYKMISKRTPSKVEHYLSYLLVSCFLEVALLFKLETVRSKKEEMCLK